MAVVFTIERVGFDPIELSMTTQGNYLLQRGTSGLGHPSLAIFTQPTAGEGSMYLGERAEEQHIALNVVLNGDDVSDSYALARRLYTTLRSRAGLEAPRIVATFDTAEVYEIPLRYVSGLEGDGQEWPTAAQKTIVVVAPQPFWTAREPVQVSVRNESGPAVEFLDDFASLPLAGSAGFGEVTVENTGDEPAVVDWDVLGPAVTASGYIDGVGWSLETALVAGESRHIDGRRATVVDGLGESRYSELGPAPKFAWLQPGLNQVQIEIDGADPGTWEPSDVVLYTNRLVDPSLTVGSASWESEDGDGVASHVTTGFNGGSAGYVQLAWSADSPAEAVHRFTVDVVEGEFVSPSMHVLPSVDQWVQGLVWVQDSLGNVLSMVSSEPEEAPGGIVTRVAVPGMIIGTMPEGAVTLTFAVSIFTPLGTAWVSGDTFQASKGAVTDTDSVLDFFDGDSFGCEWVDVDDASESVQFALELVGASEVTMSWKPRKALVM